MSSPVPDRQGFHYKSAAEDLRRNDAQWGAYESAGHCVVLAGPGSGKTKTLTIKLARMLAEDVRYPRGVVCITYSNQCAGELMKRLTALGIDQGHHVFIGTVHSFCLQKVIIPYAKLAGIPIPEPLVVATKSEQKRFFSQAVEAVLGDENPSYVRTPFDEFRRTVLDRSSLEWTTNERFAPLVVEYERRLEEAGRIDFDWMVLAGLRLIAENAWVRKALTAQFPVLVVDEYQDLGVPLHQIVQHLCFKANMRLFAVGDPDQSIYSFTGARPELLDSLAGRDEVETLHLRLNYRCGKTIIAASAKALPEQRDFESAGGHQGFLQDYSCPEGFGQQIALAVEALIPEALNGHEARTLGDIGLLYQNQTQGGLIARAVEAKGIQYVRFDQGSPYPRTPLTGWLENCANWCAGGWEQGNPRLSSLIQSWVRLNPTVTSDSARRELRKNLVGFLFGNRDPGTLLRDWLRVLADYPLWEALKSDTTLTDELDALRALWEATSKGRPLAGCTVAAFGGQRGSPDHLNLTTIHSAKGLEYDVVIMFGLEDGKFPRIYMATDRQIAESRRLFYVALTRARHEVHLLWSGWYETKSGCRREGRSRFVDDVLGRVGQ